MTWQMSTTARNNMADTFETTVGTSPTLELRTGAQPANCAAADSGSVIATITCPSNWLNAASNGAVTLTGTWQVAASATGTIAHFRLKSSGGTVHGQGSVTVTGGGGDMQVTNTGAVSGQTFTVTAFTLSQGGA